MRNSYSTESLIYTYNHPNPFSRFGNKCFSQTDEDGFTLEIIRRINPINKTFLELGVGNGSENNTLVLKALGWSGQWIGNEDLLVPFSNYTKAFITKENILSLINVTPTVLSIDLDYNDYHILSEILSKHRPDMFITEYNAKFPPPIDFVVPYNAKRVWDWTEYFGASLQAFANLVEDIYFPVVCNPTTGANAFFVHNTYKSKFSEIPELLRDIFVPPRYQVETVHNCHPQSIETLKHYA